MGEACVHSTAGWWEREEEMAVGNIYTFHSIYLKKKFRRLYMVTRSAFKSFILWRSVINRLYSPTGSLTRGVVVYDVFMLE